jgi:hypothetical protein
MKINRMQIRNLILEQNQSVITGGEASNITNEKMENYSNSISGAVEDFLVKEKMIREGERWSINFKVGSGAFSKTADIIWLRGEKSFGGAIQVSTKDLRKIKKELKKEIKKLYLRAGLDHKRIKWFKEFAVALRGGEGAGESLIKEKEKPESRKDKVPDSRKTAVDDIETGPGNRSGGGGKRRGGSSSNKCVRDLQEFLVEKGSQKTGNRDYTESDIDSKWGKNTRHAFYYFISQIMESNDDRNYERIKIDAAGYMREDPGRRGWKNLLIKMDYEDSYKGLCQFVKMQKSGGSFVPDDDEDGDDDGPETKETAEFKPYVITKGVRKQSAIKQKYITEEGTAGDNAEAEAGGVLKDASTFAFGFGYDNMVDAGYVALDLKADNMISGIPLCFFVSNAEAESNEKLDGATEASDISDSLSYGSENVTSPLSFDLAGKAINYDSDVTALILTNSYVEFSTGAGPKRYQVCKVDSMSGDYLHPCIVDETNLTVKFVETSSGRLISESKNKNKKLIIEFKKYLDLI